MDQFANLSCFSSPSSRAKEDVGISGKNHDEGRNLVQGSSSAAWGDDEDISYAEESKNHDKYENLLKEFSEYKRDSVKIHKKMNDLENAFQKMRKNRDPSGELKYGNEDYDDGEQSKLEVKLEEDTFSLMMINPFISWPYFLGIFTFVLQFILVSFLFFVS